MECIAHRGFAGVNPENTLSAVRDAIPPADGVEVDARRCGSGEVVVYHDATVDRTTDGTGPVAEKSVAEFAALRVGDSDEGIPTLAAVVDAVDESARLIVELKERGLAADVERIVSRAAQPPRVVLSSFDERAITAVDQLPTALLVADASTAPSVIADRALDHGCVAVHLPVESVTATTCATLRAAGLAVYAWTVTTTAETARMADCEVDGIIAEYPTCCPAGLTDSPDSAGV